MARALASVLCLAWLVGLFGCASEPRSEPVVLAGNENRVFLILPLNVAAAMPPEIEGASPLVWKELELYLRAQGKELKTVSRTAARNLWIQSIREVRAAEGGAEAGYDDAAGALARALRKHAEFDAMIAPSLFLREAPITKRSAAWDGVERELEFEPRGLGNRNRVANAVLEGVVPAASLHVVVLDASGEKLHEAQGGLELLVRVRVRKERLPGDGETAILAPPPTFAFATRSDLFTDRSHVREGISVAFAPFLPPLPN